MYVCVYIYIHVPMCNMDACFEGDCDVLMFGEMYDGSSFVNYMMVAV